MFFSGSRSLVASSIIPFPDYWQPAVESATGILKELHQKRSDRRGKCLSRSMQIYYETLMIQKPKMEVLRIMNGIFGYYLTMTWVTWVLSCLTWDGAQRFSLEVSVQEMSGPSLPHCTQDAFQHVWATSPKKNLNLLSYAP